MQSINKPIEMPKIYISDNTWQHYNQPSYVSPSNWNNNYQNTSLPKYPPPSELFKYQSPIPKVEIYKMDNYYRSLINPSYNPTYRSPTYSTPTYTQPSYTIPWNNYNRR